MAATSKAAATTIRLLWVRLTKTGRKLAGQHSSRVAYQPGAWRAELQKEIDALLNVEAFRAWLLSLPAGTCVGSAFSGSEYNPLARYLYSQGVSASWVDVGRKTYGIGSSRKPYDLPAWAIQFAKTFTGKQDAMKQLGMQVRARRGVRGLREFAEDLQISPATISRVEHGHQPDAETLRTLCAWLARDLPPALCVTSPVSKTLTREQALQALEPMEIPEADPAASA